MRSGSRLLRWRARPLQVRLAAGLSLILLLSACTTTNTESNFYAGNWRGALTDEVNGAGSFRVTFEQDSRSVSGTWLAVMGDDPARQVGGSLSGDVFEGEDRDIVEVTLTPAVAGECSYRLQLQRRDQSLTGDYAPATADMTCLELQRGTLQLSKQY